MTQGLRVRDLMSERMIVVGPGESLAVVDELMRRHRIRHLPVVDGQGHLLGLLSQRDLLRHAPFELETGAGPRPEEARAKEVREVMVLDLVTAEPDLDLRLAAERMLERKLGCLPVVDQGRLVGILTEADFVRLMARGQ